MKKILASLFIAGVAFASVGTGVASATQPENPGCFGQDRAAWIHAHSGAEWGDIAPVRAGDNGAINAEYKTLYCV